MKSGTGAREIGLPAKGTGDLSSSKVRNFEPSKHRKI
jgi:hypothetical protein